MNGVVIQSHKDQHPAHKQGSYLHFYPWGLNSTRYRNTQISSLLMGCVLCCHVASAPHFHIWQLSNNIHHRSTTCLSDRRQTHGGKPSSLMSRVGTVCFWNGFVSWWQLVSTISDVIGSGCMCSLTDWYILSWSSRSCLGQITDVLCPGIVNSTNI